MRPSMYVIGNIYTSQNSVNTKCFDTAYQISISRHTGCYTTVREDTAPRLQVASKKLSDWRVRLWDV